MCDNEEGVRAQGNPPKARRLGEGRQEEGQRAPSHEIQLGYVMYSPGHVIPR